MSVNSGGSSSKEQVLRGSGRGPGFIARVETEGLLHPGRGVNARDSVRDNRGAIRREIMSDSVRENRGANRREIMSDSVRENRGANRREILSTGARDLGKGIRCYACGNFGQMARECAMAVCSGWKRISSGNGPRVRGSSPVGPRQ